MATGLLALLDDVAAITRLAAASLDDMAKIAASSLDDVAAQAGKAGAKAAGVVIDDAAVTPRYVVGFAASRELPIVWRIARGSLKNKLVFLLPAALALSAFAPWAITPLLVLGGCFLCYEGAEKVWHAIAPHDAHGDDASADQGDPAGLEERRIQGAIRTDFILSAEIMAIALATIPTSGFAMQAAVLAAVGIGITVAVYGVVALIVKADDVGLALAAGARIAPVRAIGRAIVASMPPLLRLLSVVGTAAMLWVGGGIVLHGLDEAGLHAIGHAPVTLAEVVAQAVPGGLGSTLGWLAGATASGIFGLALGAAIIPLVGRVIAPLAGAAKRAFAGG